LPTVEEEDFHEVIVAVCGCLKDWVCYGPIRHHAVAFTWMNSLAGGSEK